jgi:hypothetical protein
MTLKGTTFTVDNDVQEIGVQWFRQQPKEFYAEGYAKLHTSDTPV